MNDTLHPSVLITAVKTLKDLCVGGVQSIHKKGKVTAADLATRLAIPLEMAERALKATTQLGHTL